MAHVTTVAGENFIRTPLDEYEPPALTLGLPGLGKVATEKLLEQGVSKPIQMLGMYMYLDGNDDNFIEYLERECGVVFRGGSHASAAEIKEALCATLRAKWDVIKHY